ncbi:MAG: FKBP-type peptidyl-prolyl cis-trans isomerase [Verrucomicrobiales bacterium]|nr:FKBP-type peptidyl-prolyl cis-trans isomerase [Verrucomicrobiales bacterium]
MNSKVYGIIALSLVAGVCFAQNPPPAGQRPPIKLMQQQGNQPQPPPPPKPSKEDLSYAAGMMFGGSIKRANFDVDPDLIMKAMKDVLSGAAPKFDEKRMNEIFQGAMAAAQTEMAAKREKEVVENKKKGDAFLAENAKKPGVKSLPDGLQYKVIKEGTGATPKSNDVVVAHYTGRLIDGTKFDSSYDHPGGQPLEHPANQLITGWTEALQMMKVGSKWELYVPGHLAYKERGSPPKIGPNETLIFEMELLGVKPQQPPPAPPEAASSAKPNETVVSGEIIKVPSQEEMKKGAKIEVIKQSDITNAAKTNITTNAPVKK